jgi:hypothetical protein
VKDNSRDTPLYYFYCYKITTKHASILNKGNYSYKLESFFSSLCLVCSLWRVFLPPDMSECSLWCLSSIQDQIIVLLHPWFRSRLLYSQGVLLILFRCLLCTGVSLFHISFYPMLLSYWVVPTPLKSRNLNFF